MLTKKFFLKYTLILFLIIMSVIVFYKSNMLTYSTEGFNEVESSDLLTPTFPEKTNTAKQNVDFAKQETDVDLNVSLNTLREEDPLPEYIERLIQLQKQQLNDPNSLLKIEELPEENQIQLKNWLLSYQEKGYIESSEVAFDAMELQNSQTSFVDLNDPSIVVSLQEIEHTKLSKYKYLGVVSNEINDIINSSISSITRVYSDEKDRKISLYESSMDRIKVVIIDEFVSDTINGYPATRMTFCTPSRRCFSQLKLIAKGKLYEVTVLGDKESTEDILVDIASSLELPSIESL